MGANHSPAPRRWGPLTRELERTSGPARMFLSRRFPFTRTVQREYRESVGPLAVPPGGANPGTLGGAFDMWLRFQADPHPDLRLAAHGAAWCGNGVRSAFLDLVARFGARIDPPGAATTITSAAFAVDEPDGEELLHACWAFALLVEVYRVGGVMDGSPLARVRDVADVDLLALPPKAAVVELAALADLARRRLLPVLGAAANGARRGSGRRLRAASS